MEKDKCYYCGCDVDPETAVRDHEFHQDGLYCSKDCLRKQMKEDEARQYEDE